jgi:flagellin
MGVYLDLSVATSTVLGGLRTRQTAFQETVSRLTSGLRMNTMGDDLAAWMQGVRLDNRERGWNQASQNIQNGISLLETADGGASTIQEALGRIRELAVQAASGTYGPDELALVDNEMDRLRQHIFDTVDSTLFNGAQVLRGNGVVPPAVIDLANVLPTPATNPGSTSQTQSGSYAVDVTALPQRGYALGNQPATVFPAAEPPTLMTITTNLGTATAIITAADPPATWAGIITAAAAGIGVTAQITTAATVLDDGTVVDPAGDGYLLLQTTGVGSASTIAVSTNKFVDSTGYTVTPVFGGGVEMQGTLNGVPFTANGLHIVGGPGAGGANGVCFDFTAVPGLGPAGTVDVTVPPENVTDFTHVVQMAPDYLDEHLVAIPSLRVGFLDTTGANTLGTLDLITQANAQAALDVLDGAIDQVSDARSQMGAHLGALDGELVLAGIGALMAGQAGSRITDADMAAEATNLAQAQLAQQTGTSVLEALQKQTNISLDFVLHMLQSSPLQSGGE